MRIAMRAAGCKLAAVVLIGLLAAPALAQEEDAKPWFDVPSLEVQKPLWQWLCVALFVAACLAVALKNPRRSHLD